MDAVNLKTACDTRTGRDRRRSLTGCARETLIGGIPAQAGQHAPHGLKGGTANHPVCFLPVS